MFWFHTVEIPEKVLKWPPTVVVIEKRRFDEETTQVSSDPSFDLCNH
jgi:hypothetical protein